MIDTLIPLAEEVGARLKARGETIAVAESSSGGLISAALLAVPGASAFYLGGGVIYTGRALKQLLGVERAALEGMRSSSEPYAEFLAMRIRAQFRSDWGISETGAAGPSGNAYGDAPGHSCAAIAGAVSVSATLETCSTDRLANMRAFAKAALTLLLDAL